MKNFLLIILTLSVIFIYITSKNPPTKLDFYMESLCPYCMQFTIKKLKPLFNQQGYEELVEVNYIPYGNAKETEISDGSYTFSCQHSEPECRGNLIETCAVEIMEGVTLNNFIVCLESSSKGDFDSAKDFCLVNTPGLKQKLDDCLLSEEANKLQHEMAVKTASLQPPHKWVPWVVVDGVYDDKITDVKDLAAYLCSKREDRTEIAFCIGQSPHVEIVKSRFLAASPACKREL